MKLALIHDGLVHAEASPAAVAMTGPKGPLYDIRDVSNVPGIEVGWVAYADGTFGPPLRSPEYGARVYDRPPRPTAWDYLADGDKIAVTDEMIEAGVACLPLTFVCHEDYDPTEGRTCIAEIFRAMWLARDPRTSGRS